MANRLHSQYCARQDFLSYKSSGLGFIGFDHHWEIADHKYNGGRIARQTLYSMTVHVPNLPIPTFYRQGTKLVYLRTAIYR